MSMSIYVTVLTQAEKNITLICMHNTYLQHDKLLCSLLPTVLQNYKYSWKLKKNLEEYELRDFRKTIHFLVSYKPSESSIA